jgi:predicted dehydrogenase
MADKKVRLGFLGTGGIAHYHMSHLVEIAEAQVVALADPQPRNTQRLQEKYPVLAGVPAFAGLDEMLGGPPLDAVLIQTPHVGHIDQAIACLRAGKHVLLEKPMAVNVAEAHALLRAIETSGKLLSLSYQRHFQPDFRYIKAAIDEGRLGTLTYVASQLSQDWLRGTTGSWRQDPAVSGGGQLLDSGSHIVDIIMWLTGLRARTVYGVLDNRGSAVDINSAVTITFEGGALGTLTIVGDCPFWQEDHAFYGTEGAILYRNGKVFAQERGGSFAEVTDLPAGSNPDRNFVAAILGREEIGSPAECGLRVIELTEAVWESGRRGQPQEVAQLAHA